MAWQDALYVMNEQPDWRFPDPVLCVGWIVECGGPAMDARSRQGRLQQPMCRFTSRGHERTTTQELMGMVRAGRRHGRYDPGTAGSWRSEILGARIRGGAR